MISTLSFRAIGFSLAACSTAPAVVEIVSQFMKRKLQSKCSIYSDKDGEASPQENGKIAAFVPKIILLVLSTLGLATAISSAIITQIYR